MRLGTAATFLSVGYCRLTTHSSSASPSFSRCLVSAWRALKFFCFPLRLFFFPCCAPSPAVPLSLPPPSPPSSRLRLPPTASIALPLAASPLLAAARMPPKALPLFVGWREVPGGEGHGDLKTL